MTSKVYKRCSLFKLLLVKLSSPGLGLVVLAALLLMSTSLQRNVSCLSLACCAYTSFPATRTETQRAGVVVLLNERQSNLFLIMARRDPPKISKLFRLELSRRCVKPYWVAYQKMWPRHFTCSLTCRLYVCFVPAAWSGASAKTPRNFQPFFLECQGRTTYRNSLRCN